MSDATKLAIDFLHCVDQRFDLAKEPHAPGVTMLDQFHAALAALRAQPDHSELVKDAARYRWLREQHWSDSKFAVVSNPKTAVNLGSICPSRELLDEAIDAAIGETME